MRSKHQNTKITMQPFTFAATPLSPIPQHLDIQINNHFFAQLHVFNGIGRILDHNALTRFGLQKGPELEKNA